jgi:hypothetical protein
MMYFVERSAGPPPYLLVQVAQLFPDTRLVVAVGLVAEVDRLVLVGLLVKLLLPDRELHQLLVREDLLLARHPVKVGVLRRLLVGVVGLAVEDLAERLLVGADPVRRDQLERAQRVRVRIMERHELLAEPHGVVLLAGKVDALDVLRHESQIRLLLVMAVQVLELHLDLVGLGQLVVRHFYWCAAVVLWSLRLD